MSKRFAKSIARLVGAPTPTITPILDINPFWISSKFNLPEQAINCERLLSNFFFCTWPINLSRALCLPTSSLMAITFPVLSINALDKLIGYVLEKKLLNSSNQFLTCSGRLNFELVQKALMSNIGVLIGVGAPTSLAIDLANKFDMTLVGFVKQDSFNIYSNKERIIIKS